MEEWKPIVGWEERYYVSSLGRMKSLSYANNFDILKRKVKERLLSKQKNKNGFVFYSLTKGGGKYTIYAAPATLEAFCGVKVHYSEVVYKDGNKENNSLSNLEAVHEQERIVGKSI